MALTRQVALLLKEAAERFSDEQFQQSYRPMKDVICSIAHTQYASFDMPVTSEVAEKCRSVRECADHAIAEILFRMGRLTRLKADLWFYQISEEALARRDFIKATAAGKMKAVIETLAYLRARPLT